LIKKVRYQSLLAFEIRLLLRLLLFVVVQSYLVLVAAAVVALG